MSASPTPAAEVPCAVPSVIDHGWEVSTPAALGFDSEKLCAALNAAVSTGSNLHGVIVERQGRLAAELYRKGPDRPINVLFGFWNPFGGEVDFGPTTLHDVRSVSKSVIGLLLGIAQHQGKIASLTTPVLNFYPEYADLKSAERDRINLEHLLTMSSGLLWDEGALPNDETRLFWKWKPYRYVLSRPITAEPGKVFNYNSGGTTVLADILVRATGKPLKELVGTELFSPLGITHWEWASDLHGRELAFTGLRMRPRDVAKLGRLLLNHGQWEGRQILPVEWIVESWRPRIATGYRVRPEDTEQEQLWYGYQWRTGAVKWQEKNLAWSAGSVTADSGFLSCLGWT